MRKRILVADDDAAVLALLAEGLKARGLEVTACADGASTLARIHAVRFDAGVFDIQMPGASGVDLLRRFRERQPDAPAFVISGSITSATLETVDALGVRSFEKPFDLAKVCDAVAEAAASSSGGHPWSILVVDDEPSILKLVAPVLSEQGYAVATAGDGAEAMKVIRAAPRPFDVALVDINMPKFNGVSLIREMNLLWPETLPIIMTGEATSRQVAEAYRAGAETMLRKPFDMGALGHFVEALEVTVQDRRSRAAERRARDARTGLERARDELMSTLVTPAGTRRREVRALVLVGVVAIVLVWIGVRALNVVEEAAERQAREARAMMDRVGAALERREPAGGAPPRADSGEVVPRAGLDPEQIRLMGEFMKRVEGYLQRDEQREVDGKDGPAPPGKQ